MAERRISHRFNCSVDTYWSKIFFDEAYNHELFLRVLRFESWKVVHATENDREITRVVEAVPRLGELPAPLKRLIKNGAGYREQGVFDKHAQRYTVNAIPASLSDRLTITGVSFAEPVSEQQCTRVYLATVKANIFAVGGLLESRILDDLERSYGKAAEFTNRWVAEQHL